MKKGIKENALQEFYTMILNSWTYNKLTKEEKETLCDIIYSTRTENALKGTYAQRWDTLNALYFAFLSGLGYKGGLWREDSEDVPTF